MKPLAPTPLDKRWLWTAAVGFIIFLLIQVFPVTGQLFATDVQHVMTRSEAKNKAIELATAKFGIQSDQVDKTTVTHLTDGDTTGYFSKYELLGTYDKQWSATTPADVYAVELYLRDHAGVLLLSLNMENGKLVSWRHQGDKTAGVPERQQLNPDTTVKKKADLALQYAAFWGINPGDWKWDGHSGADGIYSFTSTKAPIGESHLWMKVSVPEGYSPLASSFPAWQGGSVTYGIDLPQSFTDYMKDQQQWSSHLTAFGFLLPQIILFILAIIYTGTHGGRSSYRRGLFLSTLFFVLFTIHTINTIHGLRAGTWETGVSIGDNVNIIISIVTYALMALLTYFSAVGGDGLWKSMGRSLWPRWKESGYGDTILRSVKDGYFLAFILLGAQSLILLILEKSLGSFSSSDSTQSMYNMSIPLLLPLLAWCAGISEELQSRFFGIGVFRQWFVGIARKILGRDPSKRTAIVLTTVAIIPPGLVWALGHVGYAIFPVYTRVIELVLMSFLFGWFMLRFGIITVIFAHVTLDAILMGMQMMFDGLPGDFAGGVFSIFMPGLVGIIIWWLHGMLQSRRSVTEA